MSETTTHYDAAVIGGGVIGCSIAWRLGQAGMRVVVIERGEVGREASWAAGGILAPLAETDRVDDFFHLTVASRAMYANFSRELYNASGIDVEYRTEGTLHLALSQEDEEGLDRRFNWQREAGLNVKRLKRDCVLKLEPSLSQNLRWALKFPDDHQVENRRLAKALEIAAKKAGASILPHTEVRSLLFDGSRVRGVATARGQVEAGVVIIAAGSWASWIGPEEKNAEFIPAFQIEPVRGQMVAIEMPDPPVQHVVYSSRGYLVPRHSGYIIAGSTTEHVGYDKRVTAGGISSIIERAVEIAPALARQAILETWSGLRPKVRLNHDEWPVLGADLHTKGLIYATGHYRNGILLTPITAKAISEIVLIGESSIDIEPFSPRRFN